MQRSYTKPVLALVLVLTFVGIGLAATPQATLLAPGTSTAITNDGAARERVKVYTGTVDGPYHWGWKTKTPQTDAWAAWGGTLPVSVCDQALCASPDQPLQFVVGGYSSGPVTAMYKNDIVSRTWTQCANTPIDMCNADADIIGDTLYYVSGYSYNNGGCIDTMFKYSISGNTWVGGMGAFASGQYGWEPSVVACGGKLYRMGGCPSPGNNGASNITMCYTPGAGWTQKANMNTGRAFSAAWAWTDSVWMVSGFGSSGAATLMCEVYDPVTDVWSDAAFPDIPAGSDNGIWGGCGGCPYITDWGFVYAGANGYFGWTSGYLEFSYATRTWTYTAGLIPYQDYRGEGCGNLYQQGIAAGGSPFGGANHVTFNTYEIAIRDNDVGIAAITEPAGRTLQKGAAITPTAWVKNYGNLDQGGFDVWFVVDSFGTTVYNGNAWCDFVASFDSVQVTFPVWNVANNLWAGYKIDCYTDLPGDEKPANDRKQIVAMVTSDTVYSNKPATPPVIDGYLAGGEWSDAYFANVSNLYGWAGFAPSATSGIAYFKHDANYCYFAFGMPGINGRAIGDQVGIYLDENNNGVWESDYSEGNYWFLVNSLGWDEVQFRPITPSGPGTPSVAPGASCASTVFNGYLVFEGRIPIGPLPYQINMNTTNDTMGFWMFELGAGQFAGWWRAGQEESTALDPLTYGKFIVRTLQEPGDLGVSQIVYPTGTIDTSATIAPSAKVKNYGTAELGCTAWFIISDAVDAELYRQSVTIPPLAGGAEGTFTFPEWAKPHGIGNYVGVCSLAVSDQNANNNMLSAAFRLQEAPPWPLGWTEVKPVPLTPSGKYVKDGGWATYNAAAGDAGGAIYLAKGNKTPDFYAYDPYADTWGQKASMPTGSDGKPPYKGSFGVADGNGHVYATKGNNTLGFWKYYVEGDSWRALANVPVGASGKNVKGGTGLQYVNRAGTEFVYLLKGYKNEFYKFDVAAGTWKTLPDAPIGANLKWNPGSWISYDGDEFIYASKAKYGELWKFDVTKDSWIMTPTLKGMPPVGRSGKTKKSKDGGSAAYMDDYIYAFKGGNTEEFWRYSPDGDSWTQKEDIPLIGSTGKKKKIKAGGALTAVANAAVFGPKGNKCAEFWRYVPAVQMFANQPREGAMASIFDVRNASLAVSPNPLATGFAVLRYSLPASGPARVSVLDVTGRAVSTQSMSLGRSGSATLDLRNLSAGIYLVKIDASSFSVSQKLVVQH